MTEASGPDPTFPALHIRPPRGWLNDPNGVCLVDGRYHVFFQYNPEAPRHDAIQWGHASSTDLLSWRDEPVALQTRRGGIDANGCWSGCVVDDHGVPTAVYSAVPDHPVHAQVVLARSDRSLIAWDQGTTSVMAPPQDPSISGVRDPFVFTFEGHRYAIQGAGHHHGGPQVLVYACDDLSAWTPLGALLTHHDPVAAEVAPAQIWECPNLVQVDGRWVLVLSLWQWVAGSHLLAGVRYLLGELTGGPAGLSFRPVTGGVVDDGPTFYAPQALALPDRTLLWGWAWEQGRSEQQIEKAGWAGVLTFPRELSVLDERLVCRPAAELVGLRREQMTWSSGVGFAAAAFEIEASGPVTLSLVESGRVEGVVKLDGAVQSDGAFPADRAVRSDRTASDRVARIFVDGSLVEVFGGDTPFTTRAYPSATSVWVIGAEPEQVTVWRLAD